MAQLFTPFALKDLSLKNRIVMSPMCQYSVWDEDGKPNDWHFVHYVSRAVGGAGLIMFEMTDVHPDGRITVRDLGLWEDGQIPAFARIVDACHGLGAKVGIQLAHAGRKATSPSLDIIGPSAVAFSEDSRVPRALTITEIERLIDAFAAAARRAQAAGVDTVELHGAHGYLLHQFMSPLSNRRDDRYGEPTLFPVSVIQAVRSELRRGVPLLMRLSATEWSEEGYSFSDLLTYARAFKDAGVDLFDVSSGGNTPHGAPKVGPGYQVPFAAELRSTLDVPVAAVGMLEDWHLAEQVLSSGQADLIMLARGLLRDPYWANRASMELAGTQLVPSQYDRAYPGARKGTQQAAAPRP